jgi:hypothetical protein
MIALMAREAWTDERLDDLTARIDRGFDRVDADIREVRAEMKSGFERADSRVDALQAELDSRFDSMQRTMIIGFVTLNASVIGGLLATQL